MRVLVTYLLALCMTHVTALASNEERELVIEASDHSCIHATRKIAKHGNGYVPESCMSCDPAVPDCFYDCQPLIDLMYITCDGVCLPDGYYFDPRRELSGCFADNMQQIKIDVERCGCNSAATLSITYFTLFLSVIVSSMAIYFMS